MDHIGEAKIIRNYQYWNGFNEFYCNGSIMIGPKGLKTLSWTFLMINLPVILILIFSILVNYYNL
jgi:hypothetical protein